MSWSPDRHANFPDEATARAVATSLGADMPEDGSIPTGNRNFALVAPVEHWITEPMWSRDGNGDMVLFDPGEKRPGFWALVRFNLSTPEGIAADEAFRATPYYVATLENPGVKFAGDGDA